MVMRKIPLGMLLKARCFSPSVPKWSYSTAPFKFDFWTVPHAQATPGKSSGHQSAPN